MRETLPLLFAALLAACSGANPIDVTAYYARSGQRPMVVEAAGNGDARVQEGDTAFIRKSGVDYVVVRDARGSFSARREDVLAVLAETDGFRYIEVWANPEYVVSPGRSETVAGIKGTAWKLQSRGGPSAGVDAVLADDPSLANLGRALAMESSFTIRRSSARGLTNFEKAKLEFFAKGAVLRFGMALRLERIEKGRIEPSRFAVPQPVLDRARLRRRLAPSKR